MKLYIFLVVTGIFQGLAFTSNDLNKSWHEWCQKSDRADYKTYVVDTEKMTVNDFKFPECPTLTNK